MKETAHLLLQPGPGLLGIEPELVEGLDDQLSYRFIIVYTSDQPGADFRNLVKIRPILANFPKDLDHTLAHADRSVLK